MAQWHRHEENFEKIEVAELVSPVFKLGPHKWQLRLNPRQNKEPHTHLSLFLEALNAAVAKPQAKFGLSVKNWRDPNKDCAKAINEPHTFNQENPNWGWGDMIPRSQLTIGAGFIRRHDGALLVGVQVVAPAVPAAATAASGSSSGGGSNTFPASIKDSAARHDIGGDLLSLLDSPGPTSDLTIIATAGSGTTSGRAGAIGGSKSNAAAEEQPAKKAKLGTAGQAAEQDGAGEGEAGGGAAGASRRFEVHRAILAARCPYFATHFSSGLGDSGARELSMPDTDPDALAALLRFMYGGELGLASRRQARTCLALADRLLLPKAAELLREQLLSSLSADTITADLMWAAGLGGQAGLLGELVDFAAEVAGELPESDMQQLAAAHPALMAQLFAASVRAAKRSRS